MKLHCHWMAAVSGVPVAPQNNDLHSYNAALMAARASQTPSVARVPFFDVMEAHDDLHSYIFALEAELLASGGVLPPGRPVVLGLPAIFADKVKVKKAWKSFTAGAVAAVCGGLVTHPIDVVKVRQQLFGGKDGFGVGSSWVARMRTQSMFSVASRLVQDEGPGGLFKGATAGMMRQAAFVGTKFVLYEQLKQSVMDDTGSLSFWKRIGCGLGSGFGGAVVGNPFDLAMVRMQADSLSPVDVRRNYKNGLHALQTIVREEGVSTLWRGSEATIWRGSIITASQFAVYDQTKFELSRFNLIPDGLANTIVASLVASIVSGVASNPFDVAKSRLFYMKRRKKDGKYPYKHMFDCMLKTTRKEGAVSLYRGLAACIGRQVPLNAVRFMIMEKMTVLLGN